MTGPFKGLGDAALGMQQTTAQQNQQRVDNQRQQDALKVEQDRLKLAQQQAEQARIDTLSNAMDKSLTALMNGSKYLGKETVTQIGQMQADWTEAQTKYYATGDNSGLLAYQQKYPGNAIKVRVGAEEKVYNLADLMREIQTNKPRIDLEEENEAVMGRGVISTFSQAMTNPAYSTQMKQAGQAIMSGPGTPYEKATQLGALFADVNPTTLLASIGAKGAPQTAEQFLSLKGAVDALKANPNYKDDPNIRLLEAYYDPSVAPPEMKGTAERGAAMLKAGQDAALSSAKMPTATYRKELAGAGSAEVSLALQEETFRTAVDSANALNSLNVTDANYRTAALDFAKAMLPLKNKQDQIGVLANIAAQPGIGKAGLDKMRNDPTIASLGIPDDVWDSAITRAGAVTRSQTLTERVNNARDTSALTQYGYAGIAELRQAVENKEIDEGTATALMDLAEAQDRLTRLGVQVGTVGQTNELTRQTVIGNSIEELTQMGINVQKIQTRLGYQSSAYELRTVNGKLTLGVPEAGAQVALSDFLAKEGANQNLIIVQDGARQYLQKLTDTQYQLLQQDATNNLNAAKTNGLYVIRRTELENKLGIATTQAGIQTQTNVLTAATAVAQLVGPEAVSQYLASTAQNKTTAQQATNLLTQAQSAAPYMGTLGVQSVLSQIAQGKMTEAQATEAFTRANLVLPSLPKLVAQQVATELAQGQLTTATAKAALKNVDFLTLGQGLDTVNAIAAFGTWEEASKMPGFAAWAKASGVDKPLFDMMRKRQEKLEADKTTGGSDGLNSRRIALNQAVTQARDLYDAALKDEQYVRDVDFLKAVKDPKVDVQALMQEGFSINALNANMKLFGPEAQKAAQRIIDYKTKTLGPAFQKWQDSKKNFDAFMAEQGFNGTQGSNGSTSGGVYTADQPVKAAIESAAQIAGVPTAALYGFIGAESTFQAKPTNYAGMDYVGYGQVGAEAQADVNAMLKKKGLPALDRNKPEDNIQLAAHYLGMMMKKYPDPSMAYAAYNMGAGNFNAFLQRNGGKFDVSKLPKETQTGIANMKRYMNEYTGGGIPKQGPQIPAGGIPAVGSSVPAPAPGKAGQMKPGMDLTKMGITAINNTRDAAGNVISWCTKFAREYVEEANGLKDRALSGQYFGGTATETMKLFANRGALFATDMPLSSAKAKVGQLKQGDTVFLNYGDPALDHVAIYDGAGGFIQHSLPGFRGTTIQGAVNRMTTEDFFSKAGKATVSFGRVPAQGKAAATPQPTPAAPAKPAAAAPQRATSTPPNKPAAPTPTPAKTAWDLKIAPKPNFSFPDLTFEDAKLLSDQAGKVKLAAGQSNYQMTLRGLDQISKELIAAGYNPAQIKRYVQQIAFGR